MYWEKSISKSSIFFLTLILLIIQGCKKDEIAEDKGTIYGCVTDFATGNPVANANVSLRPGGETTLTGLDGMYEFVDVEDGDYSITVSKAEYTELIDDYVIFVRAGKHMRRDVQIEKKPTFIRITDMYGNDLSILDFGAEASIVSKQFKLFNNGTVNINCTASYSCNWITSVSQIPQVIEPGQTVNVTIQINRSLLSAGQNNTYLSFESNNGSAELQVKATCSSGNPPTVQLSPITNVTATSAHCEGYLQNANGGTITDCGFCYSTHSVPTVNDNVVRLGQTTGTFSYNLVNLQNNQTYHIRAFATSNLGTGYSTEATFATISGLPTCGATTFTNIGPTTVRGHSSAYSTGGYNITEKGLCWSPNHTPTINDQKVSSGSGDGPMSNYLYPLQPNTTYRVRSYATNQYGTTYGAETTFTSHTGLATVTTATASLIGDEIITGGTVTEDAGVAIYERGVCYGSSQNPNVSSSFNHTSDGYDTGTFTSSIPRPANSGYVYIRAYATTQYGTAYGNQISIYIP